MMSSSLKSQGESPKILNKTLNIRGISSLSGNYQQQKDDRIRINVK